MFTIASVLLALATPPALAGASVLDAVGGWGDRTWGEKFPGPESRVKDGRVFRIFCEGRTSFPTSEVVPCPNGPSSLWGLPVKSIALTYGDGTLTSVVIGFAGDPCDQLEDKLGPSRAFVNGKGMEWTTESRRARIYVCSEYGTELEIEYTGEPAAVPGTLSNLAAKGDFRGLAWGSAPDPKMKEVSTEPVGVRHLTRPGDEMKLGEYALSGVTYSYFNGRLFMVVVEAPAASSLGVLEVLRQAYGPPKQENRYIDDWDWATSNLRLSYEIAIGTKEGTATFVKRDIFAEYMKAREAAAATATQGL